MSDLPDSIIVSFSGGKDALVTLDICAKRFKTIRAFFLYWIKGLEFQEVVLQAAERRYGIEILRLPHVQIPFLMSSEMLQHNRASNPDFPSLKMRDLQDYVRRKFALHWIATGEKMTDSFTRRFMMRAAGSQWDWKRGIFYPLRDWTNEQVLHYLVLNRIALPPEYRYQKDSWGSMRGEGLGLLKKHFPADYRRVLQVFPFAEAMERCHEWFHKDKFGKTARQNRPAEIRNAAGAAKRAEKGAVQSPADRRQRQKETTRRP